MSMGKSQFFALLFVSLVGLAWGSNCTDNCDAQYLTGLPVTFCGTDLETHTSHFDALDACYRTICSVMTYYPGHCGCPNDCYSSFGQGKCVNAPNDNSQSSCQCSSGWTGLDCSLISKGNICSLRGKLISPNDDESIFPFEYCQCDNGWTGTDCSTPVFSNGFVPFGNVFPGEPYTSEEKYGDNHPVWNTSLIATVRIELDPNVFLDLLQPWNSLNQSYAPATVYFDNGYVQQTFSKVGFRQKGSGCRKHQKHCWNIKFDEFIDGQKLFGYKKLGIKGGTNNDDVMAKYMMYVDMMRAVVSPTQRTSYMLMYINDVFFGLNFMHEDIDPDFMASRIAGDDGEGNLMKFDGGVFLQYYGDDVTIYQNNTNYAQVEGDGDWTDFVSFLRFLNTSTDAEFEEQIESRVDIDALFRVMIIESFLMDTDGMARNGRNYNTYHLRDKSFPERWQLFTYDFDLTLEFDVDTKQPYMGPSYINVFEFFARTEEPSKQNPLFLRTLAIPKYRNKFIDMYKQFLDGTFGLQSRKQPSVLQGERLQFVLPWVNKDLLWQLSNNMDTPLFVRYGEYTVNLLNERFRNVTQQLQE